MICMKPQQTSSFEVSNSRWKSQGDCFVTVAPRNNITKTFFVIASGAKQSPALQTSPRIAILRRSQLI